MFSIFRKNPADAELDRIYKEKGFYCDEYVEAFRAAHPRLRSDDHFTLCELYIGMEKYDSASKELLSVRPGSLLDIITPAQHAFCRIAISLGSGDYSDALAIYNEHVKFLDTFMSNPVRSKIAGDYYSYAAILCAIEGKDTSDREIERYLARLREWCDLFPRHRLLLSITEVAVLYAKKEKEAEAAAAKCRQTILDFPSFNYEWEREEYLKKLDRATRITPEAPAH